MTGVGLNRTKNVASFTSKVDAFLDSRLGSQTMDDVDGLENIEVVPTESFYMLG